MRNYVIISDGQRLEGQGGRDRPAGWSVAQAQGLRRASVSVLDGPDSMMEEDPNVTLGLVGMNTQGVKAASTCPLCLAFPLTADEKTACLEAHGYTTVDVRPK